MTPDWQRPGCIRLFFKLVRADKPNMLRLPLRFMQLIDKNALNLE